MFNRRVFNKLALSLPFFSRFFDSTTVVYSLLYSDGCVEDYNKDIQPEITYTGKNEIFLKWNTLSNFQDKPNVKPCLKHRFIRGNDFDRVYLYKNDIKVRNQPKDGWSLTQVTFDGTCGKSDKVMISYIYKGIVNENYVGGKNFQFSLL
jgi:hypothetical protein